MKAKRLVTSRSYDRNSRVLSRTGDNGNTTSSTYDARDRPVTSFTADQAVSQVVYNADSLVELSFGRNGTVIHV